MQILKFGGTSVANSQNILKVISITANAAQKDKTIMVSSAIAGCTDNLINAAGLASQRDGGYRAIINDLEKAHYAIINEIIPIDFRSKPTADCNTLFSQLLEILQGIHLLGELTSSSLDLVMSFGELLSTTIISATFNAEGINNVLTDSRKLVKTFRHNSANIVDTQATYLNIKEYLSTNGVRLYVVPGFIASDKSGKTTTLGRGGSDYTASLFAAASEARVLEIWTDVSGMMTADPRIVPSAKTIEHISYKEALELSHFGAKVVYPPTIQPAVKRGIPIIVKNTFDPDGASTIIESSPPYSRGSIRGISGSKNIALISLEGSGMVGIPGYSARFFTSLANAKINVVLITQASSLHTMCVAIEEGVAQKAGAAVDAEFAYEISLGKVNPVVVEKGFSIVSLVGDDMKNQSGTGGKMFKALGDSGINIRAIAQGSSERNISTIIHSKDYEESVRVIHNKFFETKSPQKAYLFIAGYGTVGKELVQLIHSRRDSLLSQRSVDLVIAGICSSSKMVLDRKGISPEKSQSLYSNGEDGDINQFVREILHEQPGKTIFVDCTASGNVASLYRELLDNGVSIVTCNKIAPSSPLTAWDALKETAKSKSLSLLYETTAGAALPVIATIDRLIESGETVTEVQAILSGTLNYLFSNYDGTKPFGILLREAKELGYTEPDPSIDLSGVDVLRKCTIIARECGFKVEQKEIESTPAAPSGIFEDESGAFIERIMKAEEYYAQLYNEASRQGKRLRYTAKITPYKCSTGVEQLSPDNPLYHVEGTNNSVTVRTNNYPMGITITGAGAGARVTAGGVLNDILKASL